MTDPADAPDAPQEDSLRAGGAGRASRAGGPARPVRVPTLGTGYDSTVLAAWSRVVEGRPRSRVVVVDGPSHGAQALLGTDAPIVIGTQASCDLVLDDERASRRHATLLLDDRGRAVIEDLQSTNGVVYEGALVTRATLGPGATFRVGRTTLRVEPEPQPLHVPPSQSSRFGELVGRSLLMREVFALLELAAASEVTVLLEGETGTGKELAARAVHEASDRRRAPFVALDCGALPDNLLDSALFGHIRGAFTGATATRDGAFVRADGGTLFLDELDSVSPPVQARLLRALEERRVRPLGSDRERPINVRVLAASQRDLDTLVGDGTLRADLFYRLAVVRIRLPPLRARREDVPLLVGEILRLRGFDAGDLDPEATQLLMGHTWPGNVRELRNAVDRALALSPGATSAADLTLMVDGTRGEYDDPLVVRTDLAWSVARGRVLHEFERRYLSDLSSRHNGNLSAAARDAGMDRKQLRTLLRRHGLLPTD